MSKGVGQGLFLKVMHRTFLEQLVIFGADAKTPGAKFFGPFLYENP